MDGRAQHIIRRWLEANPLSAHNLGIHEFDGRLPDYSENHLKNRSTQIAEDLRELGNIKEECTEKLQMFELELIDFTLRAEKFRIDELKDYRENPLVYIFPLSVIETSYTVSSFASIDQRIEYITQILTSVPSFIDTAMKNLDESLPRVRVVMAIDFLKGILTYLKDQLIAFVVKSDTDNLIEEWSQANIEACESLEKFLHALKTRYLPASTDQFRLGKDRFLRLLEMTEGVDLTIEQLKRVGKNDLEKNYAKLQDLITRRGISFVEECTKDYPPAEKLVDYTKITLERTKQFLVDADIVDLPTDEQCLVIETPEFARKFGFAAMNAPGPFEVPEASEAYYWITPPDSKWPEERRNKYMEFFSKGFLEIVSIHEAWPGHYLQLLYNKQSKSEISKMMARSITMIEGWGHYCEEMIYESGYEPFDRDVLLLGQLKGALVRNCRYLAAIGMHCEDMSIEEATRLFIEKGLMSEDTAKIEANRGTVNPMYLNYTLGKLLIKKLREDYIAEQGDQFNLKEFHNTLLSFGSPPITSLRKILLSRSDQSLL